jgi:flagellar motility protein MotE (MotC chaperone)
MATTESRSGFRLPWSPDRAPSLVDADESLEGEPQAGDPEHSASGMEAAGVLEPAPDPGDGSAAPAERAAPGMPIGAPAATVGEAAPARRPSKFLIDLTHAMQAAAEQARAATLEQFRVEGSMHVERIKGRSTADADALRRHADEDVAGIKEWSKTEIARIREQAEDRITGRRGQLDAQLARHAGLVDQNVARIEQQIASFETEMEAFFDELLAETDVSILAARAQQMPEAPAFGEPDDAAFAALMAEPGSGVPVVAPIAKREPVADVAPAASVADPPTEATSDADLEPAAIAPGPATADDAVQHAAAGADSPADDPRLALLGLTPDFAAAEADAAEAAAAELSEIPELDGDSLAARLAGRVLPSEPGDPADEGPPTPLVSTQVAVTGLVSVASIASFKRHLGRQAGVRHVSVSSGPDGEFLFTVQHEVEVSLRDVIPTLPGFGARVTGGDNGVVTASAHDPED